MLAAFHNEDNSAGWVVYNSVSDTLFLVDMAINFRTGAHAFLFRAHMCHKSQAGVIMY